MPAKTSALQGLFDRGSVVYALLGMLMGMLGVPWWIAFALGLLAEVAFMAVRGLISENPPPWPHRNHVLMDAIILMLGWLVGAWLNPFGYA
jgi:hypothetical protein